MTERIKEEIKKFKEENGNTNFTSKEMLWYMMSRLDKTDIKINKMYSKFEKGSGKIAVNRESIKMIKYVGGTIISLLGLAITAIVAIG